MCALFLTSNSVIFSLPNDLVKMKYHLLPSNGVSLFTISDSGLHSTEMSKVCRTYILHFILCCIGKQKQHLTDV